MSYLFAAYSIIWAVIFFYTVYLWRKHREVAVELETVKKAVFDK